MTHLKITTELESSTFSIILDKGIFQVYSELVKVQFFVCEKVRLGGAEDWISSQKGACMNFRNTVCIRLIFIFGQTSENIFS